jgi:hypothetical protein
MSGEKGNLIYSPHVEFVTCESVPRVNPATCLRVTRARMTGPPRRQCCVPVASFLAAHLHSVLTQAEPAPAALDEAVDAVSAAYYLIATHGAAMCAPPLPTTSPLLPTTPPCAGPAPTPATGGQPGLPPPDQATNPCPPVPPAPVIHPRPHSPPGPAVNQGAGGEVGLGAAAGGWSPGWGGVSGAAADHRVGSEDGEAAIAAVADAMLLALQVRGPAVDCNGRDFVIGS